MFSVSGRVSIEFLGCFKVVSWAISESFMDFSVKLRPQLNNIQAQDLNIKVILFLQNQLKL